MSSNQKQPLQNLTKKNELIYEYQIEQGTSQDDKNSDVEIKELKKPLTQKDWQDIVGKRLDDAVEAGMFDNLPGQGKPLDLSKESLVPEDQWLANKILKNNELTPSWIGNRGDVQKQMDAWRNALKSNYDWYQAQYQQAVVRKPEEPSQPAAKKREGFWSRLRNSGKKQPDPLLEPTDYQQQWTQYLQSHEAAMQDLNRRIRTVNLEQPFVYLEIFSLRMDEELARVGAERDLG
ncbi:MAG: DUF1992 domain-containing protein [Chloroflexota bacterium]